MSRLGNPLVPLAEAVVCRKRTTYAIGSNLYEYIYES